MDKSADDGHEMAAARQSSSSVIARDVIRGLYQGRYAPGQRLAEPDLVDYYKVSRSTVREALKQLTADGIVVTHTYRGSQIRRLTRTEAANLFLLTEMVLGLAARLAAAKIDTTGAREAVNEHFEAIRSFREEEGRFEFLRRRNRYFRALVDIGGNSEIHSIMPRLQVHLIRDRLAVSAAERVDGYRRITDAILAGDQGEAEAAARAYVRLTGSRILPFFEE